MSDPDFLSYRLGGRGTGRTTRLIKATPQGGIYIVHSQAMVEVVNRYLRQIGREGELRVVSISEAKDTDKLRGLKAPIAIDHVVVEADRATILSIYEYAHRMPFILMNDYEGDVTTTYKA